MSVQRGKGEAGKKSKVREVCAIARIHPRSLTVAGEAIGPQFVALVAAAQEGAVRVGTPLGAGGTHLTFVHI